MALAYASMLDGNIVYTGTSDPTTILPVTGGAPEVTLLELGPIQGINEFSGSASVTNFSPGQAVVRADFFARGAPGVSAITIFTHSRRAERSASRTSWAICSGSRGSARCASRAQNGTLISATGREFAVFRNAQGEVVGTAGQLIPGMLPGRRPPGRRAPTTCSACARSTTRGARERSHLAAFNPGIGHRHPHRRGLRRLRRASVEGQTTLTVRGGELIQTNSIIAAVNPNQDGRVKRLEVRATGPLYVRAFRVNRDGDPITIPPQRVE